MTGTTNRNGTYAHPWSQSSLTRILDPGHATYTPPGGGVWARTVLGSALHEWMEAYFLAVRDGQPLPGVDDLPAYWSQCVHATYAEIRYGRSVPTADDMVALGQRILDACVPSIRGTLLASHEVVATELSFRYRLPGAPAGRGWLDGSIDLVLREKTSGALTLIDWKTGGSIGEWRGGDRVAGGHPQHHVYALAAAMPEADLSPAARYVKGHRLQWPDRAEQPDAYLAPLAQWPAWFSYVHMTEAGAVIYPAICPYSPQIATEALLREYVAAAALWLPL